MSHVAFRTIDPLLLDPFRIARSLFDAPTRKAAPARADFVPRFDVVETEAGYVFEADLPGLKQEDLEITLDNRVLTIAGARERAPRAETDNEQLSERVWGRFSRSFRLPASADADAITADLRDGVLTVSVAKKPEIKPRKVPIGTPAESKLSAAS